MKIIRTAAVAIALAANLGMSATLLAADGIISRARLGESNYCHLQFPAIREDTLFTDHPVLQDEKTKDIIDFYGPCDHNPLGEDEVWRQRQDYYRYRFDDK